MGLRIVALAVGLIAGAWGGTPGVTPGTVRGTRTLGSQFADKLRDTDGATDRSATTATTTTTAATVATTTPATFTGAIEGRVAIPRATQRRTANRYPGAAPASHDVQTTPVLVWLEGPLGRAPRIGPTPPVMAQQDTAFVPGAMIVPAGTTVRFPNRDPFFHNVFSYSGPARFDLGRYPSGDAKDVTFDEPGIVKVYCEVHDFMRAVIVVVENDFHAVAGQDGAFRIEGIPSGTHTLVAWHPDLGRAEQHVTVADGATARLELTLK